MIRRPPRSTQSRSSAASDVYKRQEAVYETVRQVDPQVTVREWVGDGDAVEQGTRVLELHGAARSLLAAERVALNFLQRLSGIATLTREHVNAVAGTGARILDTRKTTPGMRAL